MSDIKMYTGQLPDIILMIFMTSFCHSTNLPAIMVDISPPLLVAKVLGPAWGQYWLIEGGGGQVCLVHYNVVCLVHYNVVCIVHFSKMSLSAQ